MLYPVIESDGKAWGCVRTGLDWNREEVFHPEGGQEPEQVLQTSGHSIPVWTTLSGTWEILGAVLCRSRSSMVLMVSFQHRVFCDFTEM